MQFINQSFLATPSATPSPPPESRPSWPSPGAPPRLPTVIWIMVFEELDPTTIYGPARRVCRELYHVAGLFLFYGLTPGIWLKICVQYSDYFALKMLMKTSKSFERLLTKTKSPTLDSLLFREKSALLSIPPDTVFQLHPMLERHWHIAPLQRCRICISPSYFKYAWYLEHLAMRRSYHEILLENATSPPVTAITLDFRKALWDLINDGDCCNDVARPDLILNAFTRKLSRAITVSDILRLTAVLLKRPFLTNRQYNPIDSGKLDTTVEERSNSERLLQAGCECLEAFELCLAGESPEEIKPHLIMWVS
ncbi:hypothetical protein TWF730_008796 [Orbilia blumenaviensis]|uniref:F-box domain-containing protein n=1 Tax=Orbilia blumenaviensis TaxID=1796055 RepID=A0AAV9V779_9PEZI